MIGRHATYLFITLILCACGTKQPVSSLQLASVASPETVTLVIKNYRPQTGNVQQNLFVSNFSVVPRQGTLLLSTGRDGLPDADKTAAASAYGFDTSGPETALAGFADLLLYELGLAVSQQSSLHCASNELTSTTGDAFVYADTRLSNSPQTTLGLRDCEKVYLGLNPSKFDNAGNGIPDYLKLRCGLNPTSYGDAFVSTAGDGVANITKCQQHIPIDESASTDANQAFAYQYQTQTNADGSTDFTISNVPILNHGADNFVAFYVTETSVTTSTPSLYTAFAILKSGYNGKTLTLDYWATQSSQYVDQQITVP